MEVWSDPGLPAHAHYSLQILRNMDELIKQVSDKIGVSPDQAKGAIEMVFGFLKDKLPEPIAAQVESALKGGDGGGLDIGDVTGALGGMFGGKKD